MLASHNIGRDDKVALISDNRVEWAVTYFAANSLGAQLIPMYQVQVSDTHTILLLYHMASTHSTLYGCEDSGH